MRAEIDPLVSVLRVFSKGREHGDAYEWSVTAQHIDRTTIELVGVISPPTFSQWRAVERCCREAGIETVVFYRMRRGEKVLHRRDLIKKSKA